MDLFSFSGRANRFDFWLVPIGLTLLQLALTMLLLLNSGALLLSWLTSGQAATVTVLSVLFLHLLFMWPITAVAVRRSHDRNMSGWWYGAFALFSLGLLLADMVPRLLEIAESSTMTAILDFLSLMHFAAWLTFLVILGVLPGTRGVNRFGPAPNSRQENYRAPPAA